MRSWKVGRAFGIDLFVHWTFLLPPLYTLLAGLPGGVLAGVLPAALWLAGLGCVLLHEFGHAFMARAFGIGTQDITLYPIGGVARLRRMSEHPGEELAIALAGPLVNVVIAFGLWAGLTLAGWSPAALLAAAVRDGWAGALEQDRVGPCFLSLLLASNIVLVVFNMLPAFPLDGGRVFRALMALVIGRLRATEVAAGVGLVLAAGFGLLGLLGGQFMLIPLTLFLALVGQLELRAVRESTWRQRRRDIPWAEMADVEPVPAARAAPTDPLFTGFTWDAGVGRWVEWRGGRRVGVC